MPDKYSHRVSIKALLFDENGKLMLIRDEDGRWDLPGGSMEHGENFEQTLKREIKEEMGVDCEILDPKPFIVWSGQSTPEIWRVLIGFKTKLLSDKFIHSDEFTEYA